MKTRAYKTSFERFELKYWIPERLAREVLARASQYVISDDWAPGGQRTTSLYLDSSDLDFMRLHTESAPDRHKLRVRAYGSPPSGPAFFEIKRKVKMSTLKKRAVLTLDDVPAVVRGDLSKVKLPADPEERRTLEEFVYLMLIYRAEPKVLVTYRREAYVSIDPSEGVRLTLDREVCYQAARKPSLLGDPKAWIHLCGLGNYQAEAPTLIEIKFRGRAPFWIDDLVQRLGLKNTSYSKYVSAMSIDELGVDAFVEPDRESRHPPRSVKGR